MSKKKPVTKDSCPICDCEYKGKHHRRTSHHIFPRWWYKNSITVYACSKCHQLEFHKIYPMKYKEVWSISECMQNWVQFCKSKGKNAYEIYPELKSIEPLR